MLIKKTVEKFGSRREPHKLGRRIVDGRYEVKHPPHCECMMLHSVKHAPWITYDQMDGVIACDHCKTRVDMPCPAIRDRKSTRTIYMDLSALEDDLWKFQLKHENCPAPVTIE